MTFKTLTRHILSLIFLLLIAYSRKTIETRAIIGLYTIALIGSVWLQQIRLAERERFILRLRYYRVRLRRGEAVNISGQVLRYNSVVTTYWLSVGGLFSSVNVPSSFRIVHAKGQHTSEALWSSVISLISGWWGLPLGPLYTIQFVLLNLSGGEQLSVAELIDTPLIHQLNRRAQLLNEMPSDTSKGQTNSQNSLVTGQQNLIDISQQYVTGPGSRSNKELEKRTTIPQMPTWQQRALNYQYQPNRGEILKEKLIGIREQFISATRHHLQEIRQSRQERRQPLEFTGTSSGPTTPDRKTDKKTVPILEKDKH